jgi:hypothetical protein
MEKENVIKPWHKNGGVRKSSVISTIPQIGRGRVLLRNDTIEESLARKNEFYTPAIEEW